MTECFVSFNIQLIRMQRIISSWTERNYLVPRTVYRFRQGFA